MSNTEQIEPKRVPTTHTQVGRELSTSYQTAKTLGQHSRKPSLSYIRQFIADHRAAAFATVDQNGKPHVSIVYCLVHDDLSIYFSTRVEGRKFKNLLVQPQVAMAFSDEGTVQMVQLSGTAERVNAIRQEQLVLHDLMKLRYDDPNWPPPPLQLFERGASNEIAVIRVQPTELTFADFTSKRTGHYAPFFHKIV